MVLESEREVREYVEHYVGRSMAAQRFAEEFLAFKAFEADTQSFTTVGRGGGGGGGGAPASGGGGNKKSRNRKKKGKGKSVCVLGFQSLCTFSRLYLQWRGLGFLLVTFDKKEKCV